MAFLIKNSLNMPFGKRFFKVCFLQGQQLQQQSLKTTSVILSPNKQNPETSQYKDTSNVSKKRKETLVITLFQDQNMTVTPLEAAKNLAKRRSLHLVKVQDMDSKTQRPVYKLLTSAEMLQNELSENKKTGGDLKKKAEKSVNISARIAEHDLASRLKNISKWLNKQHEVRILIQASSEQDLGSCEKILKTIEGAVKTPHVIGKIVQKRTKGSTIKFSILPVTPATSNNSESNSQ